MQCDTLLRINSFDNYTTSNSFHQGVNIQIKFYSSRQRAVNHCVFKKLIRINKKVRTALILNANKNFHTFRIHASI